MSDKFTQLQERCEQMLLMLEHLKNENKTLKGENLEFKAELSSLKNELSALNRRQNDQAETVRTKLTAVLSRLGELETITE
jgi:predicted RNase H-like nuclease (RuvC/YqgF family)